MNSDFSDAKVGDSVWHIRHGYGVIEVVNLKAPHPLTIKFNNGIYYICQTNGKEENEDEAPSLFHTKPDCFKTKVKKTIELE